MSVDYHYIGPPRKETMMLAGKKTYVVAALMLIHAIAAYLLGHQQALDLREVLEALGLAALRAGVGKS